MMAKVGAALRLSLTVMLRVSVSPPTELESSGVCGGGDRHGKIVHPEAEAQQRIRVEARRADVNARGIGHRRAAGDVRSQHDRAGADGERAGEGLAADQSEGSRAALGDVA